MMEENDPSIPPKDWTPDPNARALYSNQATSDQGGQLVPRGLEGDSWVKTRWRPIMAWQYLLVCLFDFIGGPVINMIYFHDHSTGYEQWTSLTLQGGGLYHMAMGAIIGVTAWSRGQEKIHGVTR